LEFSFSFASVRSAYRTVACTPLPLSFPSPWAEGSSAHAWLAAGTKWLSELNLRCFVLVLDACCWEAAETPCAELRCSCREPKTLLTLQDHKTSCCRGVTRVRRRGWSRAESGRMSSTPFLTFSLTISSTFHGLYPSFTSDGLGRQAALMKAILCQEGLLADPFPASLT